MNAMYNSQNKNAEENLKVRQINIEEFNSIKDHALILDVRREEDYAKSTETLSGAVWKNPSLIDDWIGAVPKDRKVVIFCVRGGGVSNSVVDRLQSAGIDASYIEGGIENVKSTGGAISKS